MEQLELFRLLQPYIHRPDDKRVKPHVVHPVGAGIVNMLLSMNLGLVKRIVTLRGIFPFDEAMSWGVHGLRKGILRFDPERGIRPSTYLANWIRVYARRVWDESRNLSQTFSDAEAESLGFQSTGERFVRFSPERGAFANELFAVWRLRLRDAESFVHTKHKDGHVALFSNVTGYTRPAHPPQSYGEVAETFGISRALVSLRVSQVMRTFARACLMRREEFEPVFLAVIEYSLEKDLPL